MSEVARIERIEGRGMVAIRAELSQPSTAAAVAEATGLAIPSTRRLVSDGARLLVWMSPDELLLLCPGDDVATLSAALEAAFGATHHLAADMSDARALFRLTGAGAGEALAKGAPVDLARGAFAVGMARRTHLGQVAAAFWKLSDAPETYELICFRSVADYVGAWLETATAPEARVGWL
jgi:sarcosine oxidase subunit gamma